MISFYSMALFWVLLALLLFIVPGPYLLPRLLGPVLWKGSAFEFPKREPSLLVLIPAHNEERLILDTLRSIRAAAARWQGQLKIIVGADSCTDRTVELAEGEGVEVHQLDFRSKWKTLVELVRISQEQSWIGLVDAGTEWPQSLLVDLDQLWGNQKIAGVAPAYYPRNSSGFERLLWGMEAFFKSGENRLGGPVSVHGASVFYRAEAVREALALLRGREIWLNDDIAIPLAIRILFPAAAMLYWNPPEKSRRISDRGVREFSGQLIRRKRMVVGNWEWIISLFPLAMARSPAAAVVCLRRISRIFWAYWVLLALGMPCFFLALNWRLPAYLACLGMAVLLLLLSGRRSFLEAAIASLVAPFLFFFVLFRRDVSWS